MSDRITACMRTLDHIPTNTLEAEEDGRTLGSILKAMTAALECDKEQFDLRAIDFWDFICMHWTAS